MNTYNMPQAETHSSQLTQREAARLLAGEVETIICNPPGDQLRWTGTTIDLMEALYVTFVHATLRDEKGNGLSFRQIVDRVCSVLHAKVPHNPYEVACRGARRKGFKCLPFIDRYQWQKEHSPQSHPFNQLINPL